MADLLCDDLELPWGCVSACGLYRATLQRGWDRSKETAVFIMLNPSTADEREDDPTIRRCIGFARSWGCGSLLVVNLFQYRATDPKALLEAPSIYGHELNPPNSDAVIEWAMSHSSTLIAGWGAVHPSLRWRTREVYALARKRDKWLYHLGLTKRGDPRHPLYLPASATPEIWPAPQEAQDE